MESEVDSPDCKRILITGGGGYLGLQLAKKLVASKVVISLADVYFSPMAVSLAKNYRNIKLVKVDLTDFNLLKTVCEDLKPDSIFHFAASLIRERDFSLFPGLYEVNVKGTLNLLEALSGINYSGFYFASSSEIYGSENTSPFHENQAPSPVSPYSLSKAMAELLIKTYSEINNKPFTILRIFNFFGPEMPESFFINQLINKLKNNNIFEMTAGEQIRDFIFIDDLLNDIYAIYSSSKCNGEIINICSGIGIELRSIALATAKQFKKEHLLKIAAIPYRANEVWNMVGSRDKLNSLTNQKTTTTLFSWIQKQTQL